MNDFANNFSEDLKLFVTLNRPDSTILTSTQIEQLAALSEYKLEKKGNTYTISDGQGNSMSGNFKVHWNVRVIGNFLCYSPYVVSQYVSGEGLDSTEAMEDYMSQYLPQIGFQENFLVKLDKPVVVLHPYLFPADQAINTMYLYEFRKQYANLYLFMKHHFEK